MKIEGEGDQESPKLRVELDWKAYYKGFSEKHGGWPVVYKGRQWFADGWSYSSTSYSGPEWPPPEDFKELKSMRVVYWTIRLSRATMELDIAKRRLQALKDLQGNKDAPLQMSVVTKDDETGKVDITSEMFSPDVFDQVIGFYEDEIIEAREQLKSLEEGKS